VAGNGTACVNLAEAGLMPERFVIVGVYGARSTMTSSELSRATPWKSIAARSSSRRAGYAAIGAPLAKSARQRG
jgi:hypothetical protein